MYIIEEKNFQKLGYIASSHSDYHKTGEVCPTVLYLHGAGSRGTDLQILRTSSSIINAEKLDVKARIYAPQCYADTWFEIFEQLQAFTDFVASQPETDLTRFYLTGVSMGGYAAWQLGMTRHDLFAALLPVCGGGMYWNASRLKNIPVWAFHGALDPVVSVTESIHMVNAVNKSGGKAKLTIFPEAGHNAWDLTYSAPEYWSWMLRQCKTDVIG